MSLNRYARKRDAVEPSIVAALEAAGWVCYQTLPVDLLCYKNGVWRVLECKAMRNKKGDPAHDKRQKAQTAFLALTNTPIATSPETALRALEPSV